MRSFVLLTLLVATGCGGRAARLGQGAPADTVVINSRLNVALPDHAKPIELFGIVSYSVAPARVAHIPHNGAVACDTSGDATITAQSLVSIKRVFVQCRPVKSFFPFQQIRIRIDQGPVPMPAIPNRGLDGQAVKLLAGTATVRDTAVIRIADNQIHPLQLGRTLIAYDFAGMTTAIGVEVYEPIASGPLTLAGGEMKSWRLPRGRYEINLTPVGGARTQPLALSMYRANCAQGRLGPAHIHCVTYEEGALIVRNTREPGPQSSRTGNVMLIRQGW